MTVTESTSHTTSPRSDPLAGCLYACGPPEATAVLRQYPEDFQVDEDLGFEPDGDGDHVLLQVRKRGQNTQWLAGKIARLAGINERDIGYAGMKDRHAVTTQWFSVNVAGRVEPDWSALDSDDVQVLTVARHRRKLRRGTLTGNHFQITLRDVHGDQSEINRRLEAVRDRGVPNYFGEQRFGGDNLARAEAVFNGRLRPKRHQRSLYLSSARSFLFNSVLSRRVEAHNWDSALNGDVMQLAGSHSVFKMTEIDADIEQRLQEKDIHPTGPLWGAGEIMTMAQAQALELETLQPHQTLCQGLEHAGLKQQRRALRLIPVAMSWTFSEASLTVGFFLEAGSYATVVLREIVCYRQP
jgi:tRNA pseudouridine13 synthase